MKTNSLPPWAQHYGQEAVLRIGRITAGARVSPDFLICGAQRCGTTSMYRALSQHPAILKAVLHKGVHYFDTGYLNGRGWYQAHFPLTMSARRVAAKQHVTPMTFESSPYYLFHPLAAARIAADLPGVKIIVLLRDPAERAYSAHTHERARGFETEDFERALDLEDVRLEGEEQKLVADPAYNSHSHQHHSYLHRGRYLEQLERMAREVGRDRLHVVDCDDFFVDPEPSWRAVVDFLGLPDRHLPVFDQHNARPRSPMSEQLRTSLRDRYVSDDEALAKWWGRTPSWRRD
ncbi:MAG: sulfotransferase family protein [Jatrophihabitans sp.]